MKYTNCDECKAKIEAGTWVIQYDCNFFCCDDCIKDYAFGLSKEVILTESQCDMEDDAE
jgi:hypothetical protein